MLKHEKTILAALGQKSFYTDMQENRYCFVGSRLVSVTYYDIYSENANMNVGFFAKDVILTLERIIYTQASVRNGYAWFGDRSFIRSEFLIHLNSNLKGNTVDVLVNKTGDSTMTYLEFIYKIGHKIPSEYEHLVSAHHKLEWKKQMRSALDAIG